MWNDYFFRVGIQGNPINWGDAMPAKKKGAKPEETAEKSEEKKEEIKTAAVEEKKPEEKKTEDKKPEETKAEDKKPEEKKTEEKKPEENKSEEKTDAAGSGQTEAANTESGDMKDEEEESAKEPEKPKELEEDAPPVSGAKIQAGSVAMDMSSATLNVMPTAGGSVLMTLTDGGLQYLLASARTNVGVRSGRYLFELKILESLNPAEGQGGKARAPAPRQLVRVGLSTKESSIFLSDGPDNVCFDSEGCFIHEKKRTKVSQKFGRDQVVGLLLNLDTSSPNANTVSLFRDGERISEPQALPDNLKSKTLYPTITYRNVTIQLNFGPDPLSPLPFKCRMIQDASKSDVHLDPPGKHDKNTVVFPVGLPDTGVFDWVDGFLSQNPSYTELSDRKILEWASKSGLWRQKGYTWRASNDKPEMGFGIPFMDDTSVSRLLTAIAPTLKRDYVVMELKGNLVAKDRAEALARFSKFETVASVLVGEPDEKYKKLVQELLLAEKKKKAEAEKKKKSMEAERKRLAEERQKKAEAAKKARLASQKKDGEKEEEAKDEEEPKEEEKEEETVPEDDAPPPELTDEEKKLTCRKLEATDLLPAALSQSFADFSLPSSDEGFTKVKFEWQPQATCAEVLKEYVHEKKMTQRVENLKPGEWFTEEWKKWQKTFQDWKRRQMEWKDPNKKKQILAKKKEAAEKKAKEDLGEDASKEVIEQACKPVEVNAEDLDIWDTKDVMDIGSGEPLFFNFAYEDWTLLSIRYELHLLAHAFKKDMDDPERPGFVETHLAFYYNKYFKKGLNVKMFGVNENAGLIELIKDTSKINSKNMLEAELGEDVELEKFVKHTEDHRRERQRRMDAGDETAQLKFSKPSSPPPPKQNTGKPPAPTYPPARRPAVQGGSNYNAAPRYGQSSSYSAQKRPYTPPPSSYPAAKAPRYGSSYGSQGGGYRR